ncbi:hypothetical protein HAX54_035350 [Datura stramonium]|uniref:Uncharacterized protein n=1 Tax=Datura stramonium TaxID=4076 RepID=A0ABS8SF62_DATST|nr:hypothetical protein [Datura stramonium]
MEISSSKKRKECVEFDEEEEKKMDKFYELIRSFRDHASHLLVFNSRNTESRAEKTHLRKKKKKKTEDKEKEGVKISSNHKDPLMLASPSQATTPSSPTGTTVGVNVMSDYKVHGLDLNLSL